jgi:hypothetical protein
MSGGNGSDGSSRDARSSYSNSIDSKDASKHLANDALFGSFYKTYRNTGIVEDSGIDNFLIDQIHVGSTNVDAISENLGSIDIPKQRESNAAASFDSIYSPYSTYFSAESGLPHFEVPTNLTEPNSLTLNPFNPNNRLSLYYADSGSKLWTNSLADTGSPTDAEIALSGSATGWLESGHTISWATHGTEQFYDLTFDDEFINSKTLLGSGEKFTVEVENIRAVGFRSPMVLTGWGFDVDGKPVPADTGNVELFASGAFKDPSNWKSGPLDVRWDDERKVWAAGTSTKIYLTKTTNVYNPPYFSYEVDRSDSRSQFTRFVPSSLKTFSSTGQIHDPEYLAYTANSDNTGGYEQLNYAGIEYPHYEAFIIRETKDDTSSSTYYNIWTDDSNDCGHITNSGCGTQHGSPSTGKKILIENPLRQSLEVGDLAFTVKTGRKQKVNSGTFTGGTGTGASGNIEVDASGNATANITSAGSAYGLGGIGIVNGISANISLVFGTAATGLSAINLSATEGFSPGTYNLDIIPNDATADTEELDIHWILQAEFKSQQIVTHVECEGGLLQSCSMKIQTQGFKTCEWCGEDTTFINAF